MALKRISIIILISIIYPYFVFAQNSDTYNIFLKFARLYNSGDLLDAEQCMLQVLDSFKIIPCDYIVAAYNNLGATNTLLGKYKQALTYYNLAEEQISRKKPDLLSLADIYINKGLIYISQKSYTEAIEYLEKGIRLYLDIKNPKRDLFQRISTAYLNTGAAFYEIKDYHAALVYFKKSVKLKLEYNLTKISLPYLNIAKTYVKTAEPQKAEIYFLKSITSLNHEFGENYFRIAELYFDYGLFLQSEKRDQEALEVFNKSLSICLNNYAEKSPFVSLSYKYLGDYYLNQNNYDSSLVYYQKALIAIKDDFNDPDIYSSPSIDSTLNDLTLLDILKVKSRAFELLASKQEAHELRLKYLGKSLENIDLALQIIGKIRSGYLSEESRIYLAENEKQTYIFATDISAQLYSLTGDPAFVRKMFNITRKAKSAVLRDEIAENDLYYSSKIADTVQKIHHDLQLNIGAYSNLIQDEKRQTNPDTIKIHFWEDKLFEMKRENETLEHNINKRFPQYRDLLKRTEPVSILELQSNLKKNETLLEYFLANQYIDGKRKLYVYLVTPGTLSYFESDLDSLFEKEVKIVRQGTIQSQSPQTLSVDYRNYTYALYYMYDKLIRPVEDYLAGNRLIIVPDEEIAFLPFDAFLKSSTDTISGNYQDLQYLINHYTFSYAYSSSLIFNAKNQLSGGLKINAFSPYYSNSSQTSVTNSRYLIGAVREINTISDWFPCKKYIGDHSTEANFKAVIRQQGILHLAMHSMEDPDNSKYSYLLFERRGDSVEDGKLYNYEISLCRIKSPMVVLSACNTGTGTLSHGEGIMSLARGFILAGVSSVVMTCWDVNDESSSAIITSYYYYLSKGLMKNDAMHFAKLDFLKNHPPVYCNPFYWAGYEVLGDNVPLVTRKSVSGILVILVIGLFSGILIYYLRRRINLDARSR